MPRRKKPPEGWALEILVRCDADDADALHACAKPGEPAAHTYLRLAREASLPPSVLLEYRKAPLFPDWMSWGKVSPITADDRARHLKAKGFDVRVTPTELTRPKSMINSTEDEDDDAQE